MNIRFPSSQSFTQGMNAEEERQDHRPTFATTTKSPSSTSRQDHLLTSPTTTESVPSTSVLTWLHGLRAPPSRPSTSPPTSALFEGIQTRSRKRNQSLASPLLEGMQTRSRQRKRSLASPLLEGMQTRSRQRKRSLASTPYASLGNGPAFRKKQKLLPELDVGSITSPTHLSTPTSEEASLSSIEPLSSSNTSTVMSGPDPQTPIPSKTVIDAETRSRLLNMAMRLCELEVKYAQLLRDVEAFSNRAARAFQEFQRIRKTGSYSKAYSQQRLAELAIQEMQLIEEVVAYIKAYWQQQAAEQ